MSDKQRRLSPKEWAEAGALWESGEVSLTDLSKRYKVSRESLSRKFVKLGLRKGSKAQQHATAVAEEVAKNAASSAAITAARIRDTKEQHYEWAAALSRMAMHRVATAARNGHAIATEFNNLKAIEKAIQVIKIGREERYRLLGLDREDAWDDDDLPDLLINEMSAEDVVEIQRRKVDLGLGIDDEDEENDIVTEEEYPDAQDDDDGDELDLTGTEQSLDTDD